MPFAHPVLKPVRSHGTVHAVVEKTIYIAKRRARADEKRPAGEQLTRPT
jgi:hypothetical protein